jgi:carotenoid cleavage dioxygenase
MRRDAGVDTIRWFTTDPCYVFHPMNMWEEGTKIFADVMQYPRAPLFPNADGTSARHVGAKLVRWELDLADNTNTIRQRPIDDMVGEFPRLDERHAGLAYRHGYFAGTSVDCDKIAFDTIADIDFKTGRRAEHRFKAGDAPGEPVFVPRAPNSAEGDGFLLAVVYRGETDTSDLVVFDAQDVARGPIGTASLPRRVPFGFHGNWRQA